MSTVNFHYTSKSNSKKMKRANTVRTPKQPKSSISNLYNSSNSTSNKMLDSCVQFSSTGQIPKKRPIPFHFPSKDSSIGDSSIEFHEKHHDNPKLRSQSQDKHNPKKNFCKGTELSISSIYEEERRLKSTLMSNKKPPSKNPMIKSEFKSFKKYTYKALNQPEEVEQNRNILDDISDSDDSHYYKHKENHKQNKGGIIEPVINTNNTIVNKKDEDWDIDYECDYDVDVINEGAIDKKMKEYQSIKGPIVLNTTSNNGMFNYKNLLTSYYNDGEEGKCAPIEKINLMESNLKEIEMYKRSIEKSKEMIQKLNKQLEIQMTSVNPVNQSTSLYQGKLPDEKFLLSELHEMKSRYTCKMTKFKNIEEKLKDAIIKSNGKNNLC